MNYTPGQPDSGAVPQQLMRVKYEIQHAPNAPRPWISGGTVRTKQDGTFTITMLDDAWKIFQQQGGTQSVILSVDPTDSHTGARCSFGIPFGTAPAAHTVTVNVNPSEGGTVTGAGTYTEGQTATVTATANPGYVFVGWYEGTEEKSRDASYIFTPAGDVTLTAKFKLKTEIECDDEDALADARIDVGEN